MTIFAILIAINVAAILLVGGFARARYLREKKFWDEYDQRIS
jgi:hypothetical protein